MLDGMVINAVETPASRIYEVRARVDAGGRAVAHLGTEAVAFDASWAAKTPSGLPGPAELLASAFAACLLKNVERSAQLMPFRYQGADVDVTAHRQDRPPRFIRLEYRLHLVTDEPERRVRLLHENLRRFGTVYNTLAVACEIDGTVTTTPPV